MIQTTIAAPTPLGIEADALTRQYAGVTVIAGAPVTGVNRCSRQVVVRGSSCVSASRATPPVPGVS